MDSDAGSSLTRRRHRPFSLFLYLSSSFVSFIDLLQVCLLFLAPSVTAALVPDLTFEGCVCTALSRSPKTAVLSDLFFSLSSWAMNFIPMGKTCSNLSCCERSFCVGVFRCSFARSTSLGCSELYSASSKANRLLSEDQRPITFQRHYRSQLLSPVLALLSIARQIQVTKGLTLVSSILFGSDTVARASSSNSLALHRQLFSEALYPSALVHMSRTCQPKLASLSSSQCSGRERSSSPSSFSQERIFPPQSLLLRGPLGTGRCNDPHRIESREFEVRYQSLIDRIASGNFDILHNALSNFHKFVSLSLFYVGLYSWELGCWLAYIVSCTMMLLIL
ncbi:hypothetical protein Bca101_006759 [Brassica carinata]